MYILITQKRVKKKTTIAHTIDGTLTLNRAYGAMSVHHDMSNGKVDPRRVWGGGIWSPKKQKVNIVTSMDFFFSTRLLHSIIK